MAAAIVSLVLTACSGGKETAAESSASQTQTSSSQTDKLNIYNWSDYVDPATLSAFEKNTHINVRYDYYDSNEALEAKLLTGELDAQHQHCITIQHGGFTCEADTLGSHGYVYICIYPAASMDANPDRKA